MSPADSILDINPLGARVFAFFAGMKDSGSETWESTSAQADEGGRSGFQHGLPFPKAIFLPMDPDGVRKTDK